MITDGLKSYTIKQLEKKEKLNYRTIKKRNSDYIPVFFENGQTRTRFKNGLKAEPYSTKYIRKKDLDKYFNTIKKNDKGNT